MDGGEGGERSMLVFEGGSRKCCGGARGRDGSAQAGEGGSCAHGSEKGWGELARVGRRQLG